MKFDEKYWKEKCDRLQEEVNILDKRKSIAEKACKNARDYAENLKKRLCDADDEIAAMNQQFDALKKERDDLAEKVELLSYRVKSLLEDQKGKDAKNTALLQAIRVMAQGYAMGAANNM